MRKKIMSIYSHLYNQAERYLRVSSKSEEVRLSYWLIWHGMTHIIYNVMSYIMTINHANDIKHYSISKIIQKITCFTTTSNKKARYPFNSSFELPNI